MLMRTKPELIDYSYVPDRHVEIHEKLEQWARWVKPRHHAWATQPMFRGYQSKARQWEAPTLQKPINTLEALRAEQAVAKLPPKNRDALRWCYVYCSNPVAAARALGVSKQDLADLVNNGRTMLINRKL